MFSALIDTIKSFEKKGLVIMLLNKMQIYALSY